MKRLVVTTVGTVAGLAALLSFKTQSHPLANAGPLPSGGLAPSTTSTPSSSPASTSRSGATHSTAVAPSTSRTYLGRSVQTRYGIVQVEATVAGGKITDVAFVRLQAFDGRSQQINSYAAPQLIQETLKQQTVQVDTISGASYTSAGYNQSLQSALDQAGIK